MQEFVLYGNGGHGRVIKDAIEKLGDKVVYFFDQDNPYNPSLFPDAKLIIAIGNSEFRERISLEVKHRIGIIIHPNAIIANDVTIDEGTVVLANAVIQSGAKIGKHCIINAAVVVDHDVIIEDFVSIYPNSYIGGGSIITNHKTIEPNISITRNTKI